MVMKTYKFESGCMWEGNPWEIVTNYVCSEYGGGEPCKHCHSKTDKVLTRADGTKYIKPEWICPRTVIAKNEGGYNTTGVCLDCILEAATFIANIE